MYLREPCVLLNFHTPLLLKLWMRSLRCQSQIYLQPPLPPPPPQPVSLASGALLSLPILSVTSISSHGPFVILWRPFLYIFLFLPLPFSLYFRIYIQLPPPPLFSSIWRYSELLQRHFVCRLGVFCKPLAQVFGGEWRTKIGNEKWDRKMNGNIYLCI